MLLHVDIYNPVSYTLSVTQPIVIHNIASIIRNYHLRLY